MNNLRRKICFEDGVSSQSLYKILVAISLGLLGFIGTFFNLRINMNPISLYFVWSMILPMLVIQAWGIKYGLASFFIGLSAFHPFYLWSNEGWACLVGFFSNLVWFIFHGYGAEKRKKVENYFYNIYFIEACCLLVNLLLYFFLFPLLIKYNPPFWYKEAVTAIDMDSLRIFFTKKILIDFFILTGCDVLLLLPNIKKLFLFEIESKSSYNIVILAKALVIGAGFCLFSIFIEDLLLLKDNQKLIFQIFDTRDVIYIIVFMSFCMFAGGVTIRYVEKKYEAEELLRKSERKYHDIFENIHDIYCETLINGTITEISPSVKNILGYEQEEIIGKNIELIYKESKLRKQIMERLMKEKSVENLESEMRKKDGSICILLINLKLVNIEDGVLKIIGIGRDVTGYMEAKRKQTEIQEEYKLIFDKMISGMIIAEPIYDEANELVDIIAVKANPAIVKHLGLKDSEVIGNTYTNLLGKNKSKLKILDSILKNDKSVRFEIFSETFNRHLLINIFKVNNKQVGIMFQDITELKELENNLKEMTNRLKAIFESTDDIIFSIDKNYNIINFNSSLKNYMKRSYKVDVKSGSSIFESVPYDRVQKWKAFYDRALNKGKQNFEYYIESEKRYFELFFNPIFLNREVCGIAVFAKDITKRKEAEQKLVEINQELEELVNERTKELRSTLTELEAFTYTVSHDLKAPLRAIDGYSKIILEDYEETFKAEVVQMITNISNVSCDMINLIERLLSYSTTSRVSIHKDKVDIREMFVTVFNELKSICIERNIEFNIQMEMPFVTADEILLKQVVYNILSNAVKFTKNKESTIISIGYWKDKNEQIFCVEDNGVGFDMKYSGKLFGVFQRLHNKEEYEGNGIGLATVHKIIQKHGGRTWIESKLNKGTKIYFTLPIE